MRMRSKEGIPVLILTIVVVFYALATAGSAASAEKDTGPIKLGWIGNGGFIVHKDTLSAARMAVDEVNKSGGILGRRLVLLEEDDKGQVPQGVAAYKKLVMSEGCKLLILAEGTDISLANQESGAELYKEYPHISFTIGSAGADITQKIADNYSKYKFFFRTHHIVINANMDLISDFVTDMMKKNGMKKVAHIEEDASWNKASREGGYGRPPFKDMLKQKGLDPVYYGVVSIQEKMFLPIFEKVAASGAEFISTQCAYTDMAVLTKQWAVSAAKDIPICLTAASGSNLFSFWGRTNGACLGAVISSPEGDFPLTGKTLPFLKNLREKYGVGPTWMSVYAYETVYMVKRAIEKAKGLQDMEAVIQALESGEIPREESVYGRIKFGNQGIETHSLKLGPDYYLSFGGQWQGKDNMPLIWPFDLAERIDPGKKFLPLSQLRKMAK